MLLLHRSVDLRYDPSLFSEDVILRLGSASISLDQILLIINEKRGHLFLEKLFLDSQILKKSPTVTIVIADPDLLMQSTEMRQETLNVFKEILYSGKSSQGQSETLRDNIHLLIRALDLNIHVQSEGDYMEELKRKLPADLILGQLLTKKEIEENGYCAYNKFNSGDNVVIKCKVCDVTLPSLNEEDYQYHLNSKPHLRKKLGLFETESPVTSPAVRHSSRDRSSPVRHQTPPAKPATPPTRSTTPLRDGSVTPVRQQTPKLPPHPKMLLKTPVLKLHRIDPSQYKTTKSPSPPVVQPPSPPIVQPPSPPVVQPPSPPVVQSPSPISDRSPSPDLDLPSPTPLAPSPPPSPPPRKKTKFDDSSLSDGTLKEDDENGENPIKCHVKHCPYQFHEKREYKVHITQHYYIHMFPQLTKNYTRGQKCDYCFKKCEDRVKYFRHVAIDHEKCFDFCPEDDVEKIKARASVL